MRTIRLATADDAESVQAIYAPYCHTPISFELQPPTVAEMRGRLTKVLSFYPWLICEDRGVAVGYAYASQHRERAAYRWSVDMTVYIREASHRRGIGQALYHALFAMLPLQGFVNAYAGITLPNPASVGLHTALGFQLVGNYRGVGFKDSTWYDVAWFERPLQPRPAQPIEPIPLAEVYHSAAWRAALSSDH